MNHLETFLSWLTLFFEVLLCALIFARKAYKILPLFSIYACAVLTSTVCVWLTYAHFGFTSLTSYRVFWDSAYLYAVLRSLAIAELCRYGLRDYTGIWALVWRILVILSLAFIVHGAIDAKGQPNGIAIFGASLLRDFAFASIAVLAVLLLIRNYYGLALDSLQRLIAAGMCFTCAVDVIGYTIFRNILAGDLYSLFLSSQKALWPALQPRMLRVDEIWSVFHLLAFMLAMGIWCYALRKRLAEPSSSTALLPAEVYRDMSPAINVRLAAFNERLTELLKP
jgi:hypothetical protein